MNTLTPNWGANVLLNPSTQFSGGMAAPDANPRGGIFGPQGYGGGIFDSSNQQMSGLGQYPSAGEHPWGGFSEDTLAAQQDANLVLRANDYCEIAEDGVLGPATCGAIRAANQLPAPQLPGLIIPPVPGSCQSFTNPRTLAQGCAVAVPQPAPPPALPEQPEELVRRRTAGMGTWGWLAIAGLVAVAGVYAYSQTRG